VITTNVVGSGIKPVFQIGNKQISKFFEGAWDKWADRSRDADFENFHNLTGLQAQVMDAVAESGEVFVLRKRQPTAKGVPLKLQVLEADFLDTSHNEDFSNGGRIRQGIEFNQRGQRVAYHFYKDHPGERSLVGLPKPD
jgi:capsid protein